MSIPFNGFVVRCLFLFASFRLRKIHRPCDLHSLNVFRLLSADAGDAIDKRFRTIHSIIIEIVWANAMVRQWRERMRMYRDKKGLALVIVCLAYLQCFTTVWNFVSVIQSKHAKRTLSLSHRVCCRFIFISNVLRPLCGSNSSVSSYSLSTPTPFRPFRRLWPWRKRPNAFQIPQQTKQKNTKHNDAMPGHKTWS